MSCFTSQHSGWKQDTRLALRHSYQAGTTVLVSSHRLALRHNTQAGSKILVLLYVTALKLEARYSSCFTSQPSGRKQDTRLSLRHSYPVRSSMLVSSYHLALCLTNRSEARNISSCFTSDNYVRSKEHLILLYV
jgi:hypothetical protein